MGAKIPDELVRVTVELIRMVGQHLIAHPERYTGATQANLLEGGLVNVNVHASVKFDAEGHIKV